MFTQEREIVRIGCDAVVLDHDDTGIVTYAGEAARMQHVGSELGLDISMDLVAATWGPPLPEQCALLYGEKNAEQAMRIYGDLAPRYPRRANAGYLEFLASTAARGIPDGIISHHGRDFIPDELREIGINPEERLFVHGAEDLNGHKKPDAEAGVTALDILDELGVERERTVYSGDDPRDGHFSDAIGWQFIGVATGRHSVRELRAEGFRHVVSSLEDVGVTAGALVVPRRVITRAGQAVRRPMSVR